MDDFVGHCYIFNGGGPLPKPTTVTVRKCTTFLKCDGLQFDVSIGLNEKEEVFMKLSMVRILSDQDTITKKYIADRRQRLDLIIKERNALKKELRVVFDKLTHCSVPLEPLIESDTKTDEQSDTKTDEQWLSYDPNETARDKLLKDADTLSKVIAQRNDSIKMILAIKTGEIEFKEKTIVYSQNIPLNTLVYLKGFPGQSSVPVRLLLIQSENSNQGEYCDTNEQIVNKTETVKFCDNNYE